MFSTQSNCQITGGAFTAENHRSCMHEREVINIPIILVASYSQSTGSTCRAERDLKQKRQLIEDLKNKLKREKDSSTTIQEKLVSQ